MGRFATCKEVDDIETCLSALKTNIELYEEDIVAGRMSSYYLLSFAEECLKNLQTAHHNKINSQS